MIELGQVLSTKNQQLKTKNSKVLSTSELTPVEVQNRALGIADGLTSTTRDFTAWYCKAYKTLGEGKYSAIASMARQPGVSNPQTLFGYLLKREMEITQCQLK